MIPQRVVTSGVFLDRLFNWTNSFFVSTKLEQHPAEAIEVGPIFWFRRNRLANHLFRLFQVLSLVSPQIAKVIIDLSIFRVDFEDLFQDHFAFTELTL